MPIVIDGTNGITQPNEFNSDSTFGFKNRIINGAMVIDQRNAGASVTFDVAGKYPVDRFAGYASTDGTMTGQQSTIAPDGFRNSIVCTTTVADSSIAAGQYACLIQPIEGFNIADLGWGTANAKPITLSFWTRSSLTGTFGGAISNDNYSRSYAFTYTISSANTWEYKTVTIAGDTTGTWLTNNGAGMRVIWGLGVGSNFTGAAGSWAGVQYLSANGAVSVIGTLNATFYITGVQLEVGSTATSFDYRPYGTELQLCQRYFESWSGLSGDMISGVGQVFNSGAGETALIYRVEKRAAPVISTTGSFNVWTGAAQINPTSVGFTEIRVNQATWQYSGASSGTTGQTIQFYAQSNPSTVSISAEL